MLFIIFISEIIARLYIASSPIEYLSNLQNWFDVLSVVPFIVEVISSLVTGSQINFSFISSSPSQYNYLFFKVLKVGLFLEVLL